MTCSMEMTNYEHAGFGLLGCGRPNVFFVRHVSIVLAYRYDAIVGELIRIPVFRKRMAG